MSSTINTQGMAQEADRCMAALKAFEENERIEPLTPETQNALSFGVQWADAHRLPNPAAKAFYDLVREMRDAQRRYFQARRDGEQYAAAEALNESRALERQVDAIISRTEAALAGRPQPIQTELNFDNKQ